MTYPCLIDKRFCKTLILVTVESEELDKYGDPSTKLELNLKCNYQDKGKTILTKEQKVVQLSAVALFPGDIAPGMATLSGGKVKVFEVERKIYEGTKARNPDGSVNYTRLDLI